MKAKSENGIVTIYLEGRVDSSNAQAVENELNTARASMPGGNLVLDLEKLEYISSAGLRVILRTRKAEPALKLIGVNPEVYEIFDMTGFTEMMTIEKAYRRMSVEGCEIIGRGSNGIVYRLDPDTIIKVYRNSDALPEIHRERELARKAFTMDIPTAIPYDVVKVGDSYGSVFELLSAKSFSKLIKADPDDMDKYVKLYVELLKKLHSTHVEPGVMPDEKSVVLGWAKFLKDYLPEAEYNKLCSLIEAVPACDTMLHGDYHTNNVMMQNGEVLLIDMDTLCLGHPVFEFASIFLAYVGFGELDHSITQGFMGLPYELTVRIWRKTLEQYFETTDDDAIRVYEDKAKLIGYTRLMRRTIRRIGFDDPAGAATIENCRKNISELLARVDTLTF